MKYTKKTSIEEIRATHDVVIGGGNSIVQFERFYNPALYKLDGLINGQSRNVGKTVCGYTINPPEYLERFAGKRICVIIYPNIENECLEQIGKIAPEADSIVGRLVDNKLSHQEFYASDAEDKIFLHLLEKLGITDPYYMDIGVCHPVVANNTYLLYEKGLKHGILVEPNPVMAGLAKEYRPDNQLLNVGVTAGENGILKYCSGVRPGKNYFLREGAAPEEGYRVMELPVLNINQILKENGCEDLDLLDIDIEGMDYEVLNAIDFDKYRIRIVCAEYRNRYGTGDMDCMMNEKGYIHWMSTRENHIYLRKELLEQIK